LRDGRFEDRFEGKVFRFYGECDGAEGDDADWQAFRYRHGIAEGAVDMPPEKALPLEAQLDRHGGINFEKGCYIGQEVTARTRYRGLLKRRYMTVTSSTAITAPCDLDQDGKNAGHLLAMVADGPGWVGLASIRLEAVDNNAPVTAQGHPLSIVTHDDPVN
ncbi:MAG: tRNA-modifying protein YgfZ, partial [Alphaproteobacteria bacterium]|nr:tRNA-modifying protein YgfZ [Alphaproteobacteria bacterium]